MNVKINNLVEIEFNIQGSVAIYMYSKECNSLP